MDKTVCLPARQERLASKVLGCLWGSDLHQVEIEVLGGFLEPWRLSGREAPYGCTTAFAMLHCELGDLFDKVVHSCGLQFLFRVTVHHRELGHDKSAFTMRWIESDLIVA
tara:strand:+ start:1472 stop:1801 length:330 start_codon:yes stop_codon:yes gene_type:complete